MSNGRKAIYLSKLILFILGEQLPELSFDKDNHVVMYLQSIHQTQHLCSQQKYSINILQNITYKTVEQIKPGKVRG